MSFPKCPKCGEPALEIGKAKTGWHYVQMDGRGYHVGGKLRCKCACGNVWEE